MKAATMNVWSCKLNQPSFILHPCSFIPYNDAMPRSYVNKGRRKRASEGKNGKKGARRGHRVEKGERPTAAAAREDWPKGSVRESARPLSRELRRLLEGIGTPAPAPFKPDPFQLEALSALEHEDVLVTAPTGSGKTWIAREEIRRLLAAGKRAWYTSPLKALTNSKYQEFREEFGAESVGILTGDRKEN